MKTERKFTWCIRYYDIKAGSVVLKKLSDFNTETEYYNIEHIDSISHLRDMDE